MARNATSNADFKRRKRKLGKKAPPPSNVTDTSFKSKTIYMASQTILQDSSEIVTTHRKQSVPVLLGQLRHYNERVRKEALMGLRELCMNFPVETGRQFGTILQGTIGAWTDDDPQVRKAFNAFLQALLPTASAGQLQPFIPLVVVYSCSGFTNLDERVRRDSVRCLEIFILQFPTLFTRSNVFDELFGSFSSVVSVSGGTSTANLPSGQSAGHPLSGSAISGGPASISSSKSSSLSSSTKNTKNATQTSARSGATASVELRMTAVSVLRRLLLAKESDAEHKHHAHASSFLPRERGLRLSRGGPSALSGGLGGGGRGCGAAPGVASLFKQSHCVGEDGSNTAYLDAYHLHLAPKSEGQWSLAGAATSEASFSSSWRRSQALTSLLSPSAQAAGAAGALADDQRGPQARARELVAVCQGLLELWLEVFPASPAAGEDAGDPRALASASSPVVWQSLLTLAGALKALLSGRVLREYLDGDACAASRQTLRSALASSQRSLKKSCVWPEAREPDSSTTSNEGRGPKPVSRKRLREAVLSAVLPRPLQKLFQAMLRIFPLDFSQSISRTQENEEHGRHLNFEVAEIVVLVTTGVQEVLVDAGLQATSLTENYPDTRRAGEEESAIDHGLWVELVVDPLRRIYRYLQGELELVQRQFAPSELGNHTTAGGSSTPPSPNDSRASSRKSKSFRGAQNVTAPARNPRNGPSLSPALLSVLAAAHRSFLSVRCMPAPWQASEDLAQCELAVLTSLASSYMGAPWKSLAKRRLAELLAALLEAEMAHADKHAHPTARRVPFLGEEGQEGEEEVVMEKRKKEEKKGDKKEEKYDNKEDGEGGSATLLDDLQRRRAALFQQWVLSFPQLLWHLKSDHLNLSARLLSVLSAVVQRGSAQSEKVSHPFTRAHWAAEPGPGARMGELDGGGENKKAETGGGSGNEMQTDGGKGECGGGVVSTSERKVPGALTLLGSRLVPFFYTRTKKAKKSHRPREEARKALSEASEPPSARSQASSPEKGTKAGAAPSSPSPSGASAAGAEGFQEMYGPFVALPPSLQRQALALVGALPSLNAGMMRALAVLSRSLSLRADLARFGMELVFQRRARIDEDTCVGYLSFLLSLVFSPRTSVEVLSAGAVCGSGGGATLTSRKRKLTLSNGEQEQTKTESGEQGRTKRRKGQEDGADSEAPEDLRGEGQRSKGEGGVKKENERELEKSNQRETEAKSLSYLSSAELRREVGRYLVLVDRGSEPLFVSLAPLLATKLEHVVRESEEEITQLGCAPRGARVEELRQKLNPQKVDDIMVLVQVLLACRKRIQGEVEEGKEGDGEVRMGVNVCFATSSLPSTLPHTSTSSSSASSSSSSSSSSSFSSSTSWSSTLSSTPSSSPTGKTTSSPPTTSRSPSSPPIQTVSRAIAESEASLLPWVLRAIQLTFRILHASHSEHASCTHASLSLYANASALVQAVAHLITCWPALGRALYTQTLGYCSALGQTDENHEGSGKQMLSGSGRGKQTKCDSYFVEVKKCGEDSGEKTFSRSVREEETGRDLYFVEVQESRGKGRTAKEWSERVAEALSNLLALCEGSSQAREVFRRLDEWTLASKQRKSGQESRGSYTVEGHTAGVPGGKQRTAGAGEGRGESGGCSNAIRVCKEDENSLAGASQTLVERLSALVHSGNLSDDALKAAHRLRAQLA